MFDMKSVFEFVDMVLWEGVDVLTGGLIRENGFRNTERYNSLCV
jgi:hypothetical protein